ncbi:SCP2 sterol-binding domain-containing protein [Cognatishimia sp. WU-CL00825]|uniref:ubiquinone anaerobic biosynthesis accessory factor UbiT n=1 Tax=Cognatishimia sp. WU-CL00825 TaxID=3127658 RepID=UPI0031070344
MASYALRLAPLRPLSFALTSVAKNVAKNHPGLFRRLGEYGDASFVLDPTDLPFVILLNPNSGTPSVIATRRSTKTTTRIAGPFAALLGLVHGKFDGDALFFSRNLVIEGDTSAALALRNAIDDAELDLAQEFLSPSSPLSAPLQRFLTYLEQMSGVCFIRPEDTQEW